MTQRSTELIQYLAKQRPRKLFSILNKVQGHGVGRRVTRVVWKQEEPGLVDAVGPSYWTVTRVRPDQVHWSVLNFQGFPLPTRYVIESLFVA